LGPLKKLGFLAFFQYLFFYNEYNSYDIEYVLSIITRGGSSWVEGGGGWGLGGPGIIAVRGDRTYLVLCEIPDRL
jgi:hypothetical protein